MFLSDYITSLRKLLNEHGDTDLIFTSIDDEGNGYNRVTYEPELRLLSPHEDSHRPEGLMEPQNTTESLEDWLADNYIDEEDVTELKTAILL